MKNNVVFVRRKRDVCRVHLWVRIGKEYERKKRVREKRKEKKEKVRLV